MGKMIPWDLPEVAGGSIGGFTPAPTPDPPAPLITTPYILDNATFTPSNNTAAVRYFSTSLANKQNVKVGDPLTIDFSIGAASITTAGIEINDTSAVSQIIAHCKIDAADIGPITVGASSYTKAVYQAQDVVFDVDVTAGMITRGATVSPAPCMITIATCKTTGYIVTVDVTISEFEITSIDVYNGAGVVLQSWTPGGDEE